MNTNGFIFKRIPINISVVFSIILLFSSCNTINLYETSQANTTQPVYLGSIGSEKDFFLQKGFNSSAIPSYKNPIKLSVVTKPFNKQTYKAFTKAKGLQSADINIHYVDSIPNRPKYIQLNIADKVAVINSLNSLENKDVKDYLSLQTYANVLTGISLALNQKDTENITNADAVFLIENGLKTYGLLLYKDKIKTGIISFNQGVVFAYETSNCCWQESKRHQINIVDLVDAYINCPKGTYRSAKRAKKPINYYKL